MYTGHTFDGYVIWKWQTWDDKGKEKNVHICSLSRGPVCMSLSKDKKENIVAWK